MESWNGRGGYHEIKSKEKRGKEPCNGDYQHGKKEVMAVQSGIYYLTGREHHSGSSIDFQVTEIREWAAAYMPAALSHIIERRCLLWQKRGKTAGEEY